jgi:hypothetical protein
MSDPRKQKYALSFMRSWQQAFSVIEYWQRDDDEDTRIMEKHGAAMPVHFTVHPVRIFRDWRGMPVAWVLGKTLRGN